MLTEKEILVLLLTHPAAYHCGLFGTLIIRSVESGEFCVWLEGEEEKIFDSVEDAVDEFLKLRNEEKIGLDWEIKFWEEEKKRG